GGGLPENLERLLGDKGADLKIPRWELGTIPKVLSHVEDQEAVKTFNMGWGWVAVVPASQAEAATGFHPGARVIGEISATHGVRVEVG
ncbi:MAG: phosphoribosylformylglycinamidine cyclo-ligase, partial [Verrucomicrobiae bacterium]|nr:phosphoribosylformylglycinamidine cyclo-ligase [Verrucomicrobiae bacterium]